MAIPTSRTSENAIITVDTTLCKGCALCIEVCKDFSLVLKDKKACVSDNPVFGCMACGHCMAICPEGAIKISGRCMSTDDLFDLCDAKNAAGFDSLFGLLQKRRSIREFRDIPVEKEIIEKVLSAAKTAPMGLPPSDVNVLVFDSKEKIRAFAEDFCRYLEGMKWLVSDWFLNIMKPFWGKENDELFRGFVKPCIEIYTEKMKQGVNVVNYDAPAAMYFYGSQYCDPADPIVAATYAMIAAESLGLGTCMLGAVHPMIQNGRRAAKFRKRNGIRSKSREGLFVIMGYPSVKYRKGIKRSFANIDFAK
ncbi:nitroreductase family protein [Desulforegula conservatrix]|uniref:nitroreductase family protein n=1 Tax=Desulforegula conservatrix TaxID=153026 RepID=UPI00040AE306|nr:nitroreductase family protein [Desulforegula conservatrix]